MAAWAYGCAQPFVGGYFGGGFQNTNFTVNPPFNVNSSGFLGGGFGGVLLPVPNTNVLIGPRLGIQGSNITGSITSPAASPAFNYSVTTNWTAYEEALIKVQPGWTGEQADLYSARINNVGLGFTGSVGVAESGTSVKGTSGTFSVTDNAVRTGITFTAGFTVPVYSSIDLFAQYRGIQWISNVAIPGAVPIGSYTNEVDLGLQFRFSSAPPPPPQ